MNGPELKDIHLPTDALWWPPAPGWWLLALLVALLAISIYWLRHRLRHPSIERLALGELEQIRAAYQDGRTDRRLALDAAARLLRRILIGYRGRAAAAASTGDDWIGQLEQLVPQHGFSAEQLQLLARGRYRADAGCDIEALLEASERWIRALPRGRNHAAG